MSKIDLRMGEEVSFIHESGKGTICSFRSDGMVMVITEDGFETAYPASVLVPRFDLRQAQEALTPEPKVVTGPVIVKEMKGFSLGQRVHLLDSADEGMILKFYENESADVEFEDLFVKRIRLGELINRNEKMNHQINESIEKVTLADIGENSNYKNPQQALKDRKDSGVWEVDLHIQELIDNSYGMMNHEIVQLQLDTFSQKLDEAIEKDMKKVIFIHGRGEGRLRSAIREVLTRYSNCECLDADYQRYGVGATEVRIKYRLLAED